MKSNRWIFMSCLLVSSLHMAAAIHADEHSSKTSDESAPSEEEIAESLKKLVFVPHDSGAPQVTDAGGVRAVSVLPNVELLAPERMARTLSPTPTLYWHISKAAEHAVRFTLLADDPAAIDPLLEFEIDGVDKEGIYGVDLLDHGVTLTSGERYIWSVAVSTDSGNYGSDLVAQTVMEHAAAPALADILDGIRPEERAVRLAGEGYWYDAVDVLSARIEDDEGGPWQTARAHLLDEAGLLQAARYDWQGATR